MASILNADTSNGLKITSDTSGEIKLQSAGVDKVTMTSSGNVGIGTSSPTTTANKNLHIAATSGQSSLVTVTGNGATGLDLLQGADSTGYLWLRDNAELLFGTNNATRMRIDSSGRVTTPNQPAFLANFSGTGRLGTGTSGYQMVMDQTLLNIGSHYSTSTGRFTAPVDGTYYFSYVWQHSGVTGSNAVVDLYKNGTGYGRFRAESNSIADYSTTGVSGIIYLSTSDYITLYQSNEGAIHTHYTFFAGHLLG